MPFIYTLADPRVPDHIRYVGMAFNPRRPKNHIRIAREGKKSHCYNWIRTLLSAGVEPDIAIIETCSEGATRLDVGAREMFYIKQLRDNGHDLTNTTEGGDGGATMLGKKFSAETCAKIGAAHKGKKLSPEQRKQISEANRNRSKETRAKMSLSAKARQRRPATPETRAKISARHKGKRMGGVVAHSEETRAKMSAAKKLGWATRRASIVIDASFSPAERFARQLARAEKKLAKLRAEIALDNPFSDIIE